MSAALTNEFWIALGLTLESTPTLIIVVDERNDRFRAR